MMKIINFVKKHWLITMIIAIVILSGVNLLLKKPADVSPQATPSLVTIANYEGLIPGNSTEDDIREVLGTPEKTSVFENKAIDEFKTTTGLRKHEAVLENGKLSFFREIVTTKDSKTSTDIKNIYGKPTYILYDPNPNATFDLYVYPASGIAYLGHEDGGLLEVWYFKPTDIENFIKTWGTGYQKDPNRQPVQ